MKNELIPFFYLKKTKKWYSQFGRYVLFLLFLLGFIVSPTFSFSKEKYVKKSDVEEAVDISVQGQVTDEEGAPIIGASIQVKGTTRGTITDNDGKFTLDVPENAVLVVSSIGYETKEVNVSTGNQNLEIQLNSNSNELNQVVVIGYGTQRKEAVTGSVSSISGDDMREVPSSNISEAMQGRLPGVQITQTSSKPGSDMQIRIRGTRSLTASNNPLVVLDGIPFPGDISDISPSIIKSIDILKDASATAIYGSRGANGVILITTKKGNENMKPQISYNSYFGVKNAIKYPMMNAREFTTLKEDAKKFTDLGSDEDTSGTVNTDWQNLLYRPGWVTNHDIAITSGTDNGSYSFGGTYYKDQAVIPLQNYTRYSMHGSIDQEIGSFIKVGVTTNTNYSITNGASLNTYDALSATPITNPYNEDGSLKRVINMALDQNWTYTRKSLESLGDKFVDQTKTLSTYNSIYGQLRIPGIEGLKYKINVGLNYKQSNYGHYQGYGVFSSSSSTISDATISNAHNINWSIENLLIYDHIFAQKHNVNITALYSTEQTTYKYSKMNATGIQNDDFQFHNMGAVTDPNGIITVDPNNQNYWQRGLVSFMGRILYTYDDRYMFTGTIRSDGSSVLAPGHKWHTYTAASGGWNISRENFMDDVDFIDNLKLRIGFGQTSNQSINPYQTLGLLSTVPYNFGPSTYVTGYEVSKLPNSGLGWEYTKTWNFGLDFSFFRHRLSGTLEYYIEKTNDLLFSVDLPPTSGVGSVLQNVGKTQNKGLEFSLNGVIIDHKNGLTWNAGINISGNRNKLTSLASGATRDLSNWWFVGYPVNVIFDYKKIGLWQKTDKDYKYLQDYEPGGAPGMIKVDYTGEYNQDGSPKRAVSADDRQVINIQPIFRGGFNTSLSYKSFDLTIVGQFQDGGTLISTLYGSSGYLNMESGRRNNVKIDYWTPENTDTKFPNPAGPVNSNNPKYGSILGYFDASYLKVKTITLGYTFGGEWMQNAGIQKMRIYVTAQNPGLILFSPYHRLSGLDPEPNSYGDENQAVTSYPSRLPIVGLNTPSTRNFLVGLNLSF